MHNIVILVHVLRVKNIFFSPFLSLLQKVSGRLLPQKSKKIMMEWLLEHADCPYPSRAEKEALRLQTKLTITQINNWFTNARRRILK